MIILRPFRDACRCILCAHWSSTARNFFVVLPPIAIFLPVVRVRTCVEQNTATPPLAMAPVDLPGNLRTDSSSGLPESRPWRGRRGGRRGSAWGSELGAVRTRAGARLSLRCRLVVSSRRTRGDRTSVVTPRWRIHTKYSKNTQRAAALATAVRASKRSPRARICNAYKILLP